MSPTAPEVLATLTALPQTIGQVGLAVLSGRGLAVEDGSAGQVLAAHGVSLSALQRLMDELVNTAQVMELRGRQLWERGLPTEGTKSGGRYFLLPG